MFVCVLGVTLAYSFFSVSCFFSLCFLVSVVVCGCVRICVLAIVFGFVYLCLSICVVVCVCACVCFYKPVTQLSISNLCRFLKDMFCSVLVHFLHLDRILCISEKSCRTKFDVKPG